MVAKTSLGTKIVVAQMSFFGDRWHKCRFLGIGGTKVNLVEGGKNVVVAVAKMLQRKNDFGKKVAASSQTYWEWHQYFGTLFFYY
jgi:hypothetical protein